MLSLWSDLPCSFEKLKLFYYKRACLLRFYYIVDMSEGEGLPAVLLADLPAVFMTECLR